MMDEHKEFIGKYVTIVKSNGFVLDGLVTNTDSNGFMFKTPKMTSYLSWSEIRSMIPKVD